MWATWWNFVVDIAKKLIVAIISVPILAGATIIYLNTIWVAVSSFGSEWYTDYWYLVLTASLLVILEAYVLYKHRELFPKLLIFAFILAVVFSLYRLHALPAGLQDLPLLVFFCLFVITLFHFAVIAAFIGWRTISNML